MVLVMVLIKSSVCDSLYSSFFEQPRARTQQEATIKSVEEHIELAW
jgi:hypothetical protein